MFNPTQNYDVINEVKICPKSEDVSRIKQNVFNQYDIIKSLVKNYDSDEDELPEEKTDFYMDQIQQLEDKYEKTNKHLVEENDELKLKEIEMMQRILYHVDKIIKEGKLTPKDMRKAKRQHNLVKKKLKKMEYNLETILKKLK